MKKFNEEHRQGNTWQSKNITVIYARTNFTLGIIMVIIFFALHTCILKILSDGDSSLLDITSISAKFFWYFNIFLNSQGP